MKIIFLILFFTIQVFSQKFVSDSGSELFEMSYSSEDSVIVEKVFNLAKEKDWALLPVANVIYKVGQYFEGTPYEAGTLENEGKEIVVIHLTGLDCYTFVEACLTFARCIKTGKTTFGDYIKELIEIRYRSGIVHDYTCRLHYFSDWISYHNESGKLKNITEDIGGIPFEKKINFMSRNSDKYPELKSKTDLLSKIKVIEALHSSRKKFFIPQNMLSSSIDKINTGYIIGITTDINGLDISHTGIAVKKEDGFLYLMHAPRPGQSVQVTNIPLSEYIKNNKKQTGVMVAAPLEP